MSREVCSVCEMIVSTTAEPTPNAGYFVSRAELENLEVSIVRHGVVGSLYERFRHLPRIVLCQACRERATL